MSTATVPKTDREILLDLPERLAFARELVEVNIAAGIAAQELRGEPDEPYPDA